MRPGCHFNPAVTVGVSAGWYNMAVVRHFALNFVRSASDKKSIKLRRKIAGWKADYLGNILTGQNL